MEQEVREFIESALSHVPEAKTIAASKTGALRAYAEGVNAGMEESLRQTLQFLDSLDAANHASDLRDEKWDGSWRDRD